MNAPKIAVVTGGSSGIGLAAVRALVRRGCRVYELSRRETGPDCAHHLRADVTDETSVQAAFSEVLEREGRVDILICCAGYGISGAVEFTTSEDAHRQLEVNFFGVVNACRAVLPAMRRQRGGRIVCISSVAAVVPIPFQTYYSVSKAAINAFCMALQSEVRPFGIRVCAVMPGDIRTGFTAARVKSWAGDELYGGRISGSVAVMEKDERNGMPPERVGEAVARTALARAPRMLRAVGAQYQAIHALTRVIPYDWVSRLVGKIYGK